MKMRVTAELTKRVKSFSMEIRKVVLFVAMLMLPGLLEAACTEVQSVSIALLDNATAVEHNPFADTSLQKTSAEIVVTFDEACDSGTSIEAKLNYPSNGTGSIAEFPGVVIAGTRNSRLDTIYKSKDSFTSSNGQSFKLEFDSISREQARALVQVMPMVARTGYQATQGYDAPKAINVGVELKKLTESGSENLIFANTTEPFISIPVRTVSVRAMSLVSDFSAPSPAHEKNFGTLSSDHEALADITTLYLWNNSGETYLRAASSWHLEYAGDELIQTNRDSGSAKHRQIPFSIKLTKGKSGLRSSNPDLLTNKNSGLDYRESRKLANSTLGGDVYTITAIIEGGAAAGKRAGEYSGTVDLTLTPLL